MTCSGPSSNRMRRSGVVFTVLAILTGALLVAGCGSDKEERGIADFPEVSTPESREAMAESEEERAEKTARELSE